MRSWDENALFIPADFKQEGNISWRVSARFLLYLQSSLDRSQQREISYFLFFFFFYYLANANNIITNAKL